MEVLVNNGLIENPQIEPVLNGEYEYGAAISEDTEVLFNSPESAFTHLVAVRKGDKLLKFVLDDAEPTECVVQDSCIIYPEAFLDTDVYYTVSSGELKEDIMLNSAMAPKSFTFSMESEGVAGSLNEDGSITYLDSLSGEHVWTIAAPYAVDAAGVNVLVQMVYGEGVYSLTVETNENTAYPVRLDPTVATNMSTFSTTAARKIVKDLSGVWHVFFSPTTATSVGHFTSSNLTAWTQATAPVVDGYTGQTSPSAAIDSSGNIHLVWTGKDASSTINSKIKYSRWNGTSWSNWANIANVGTYTEGGPSIYIDASGVIHVIFHGFDASYTSHYQVKYIKSTDGGSTWSAWKNISPSSTLYQLQPNIAVDSQGVMHATWQGDAGSSIYRIRYSKSTDGGANWVAATDVSGAIGYTQQYPIITVDKSDKPHIVWQGADSGSSSAIQIKHSYYNGTSWLAWANIGADPGYAQQHPTMNVDPSGKLQLVCQRSYNGSSGYGRLGHKVYDGTSWSAWTVLNPTATANCNWPGIPAKFEYVMPVVYGSGTSSVLVAETLTTEEPPSAIVDEVDFDLIRPTIVSSSVDADTERSIAASDSIYTDTDRHVSISDIGAPDTTRSVAVAYSIASDSVRTIIDTLPVTAVTDVNTMATNGGRKIVRDSKGYWHVVYKDSTMQIAARRAKDLTTWQDTNPPTLESYTQYAPSIAADALGNVHLVWYGTDANSGGVQLIKYSRFDGHTWTAKVNITSGSNYHENYPSIHIGSNNVIHVVYNAADAVYSATRQIKHIKSEDGGASWSSPKNISPTATYGQYFPSVAGDKNNTLHAVWQAPDASTNQYQIQYSTSTDGGSTWSTCVNVSNTVGYEQGNPVVVVGKNNQPHIFWRGTDSGSGGKYRVKHTYLDGTWAAWENVNPITGYSQGEPSVTVDPWGTLHLVTHSADADNAISRVRYAKNDGTGWTSWVITSPDAEVAATYPGLPEKFTYEMPLVYAEYNELVRQMIVTEKLAAMPDEGGFDLLRRMIATSSALSDTRRVLGLPDAASMDALRKLTAAYSGLHDTKRPVLVADVPDIDVARRLVAADQIDTDTYRALTALDSVGVDTARKVLVAQQAAMDVKRRLSVSNTASYDTLRSLVGATVQAIYDLTRRTAVTDSSSYDTVRALEAFLLSIQAAYDVTRPVTVTQASSSDTYRKLFASDNSYMDSSRRLLVSDWTHNDTLRILAPLLLEIGASFDVTRKLVYTDEVLADTLRRAYSLLGAGSVELTASFVADLMGALRLKR